MIIEDKNLFGIGIGLQLFQWLGISIFVLSLLDWSWFSLKYVSIGLVVFATLLYNGISIWLIKSSLKK